MCAHLALFVFAGVLGGLTTVLFLENRLGGKLDRIIECMATKTDLDNAVAQIKQDVTDAVKRASDALAALQAKLGAGEDFSQEVADLTAAHAALAAIAAPPASAPTPTP